MRRLFIILLAAASLVVLSSCQKKGTVDIVVENPRSLLQEDYFMGITPDIFYDHLVEVAGSPMDYLDSGKGEDKEHSAVYYTAMGKIICHWSVSKNEEIGMIDFFPHLNKMLLLTDAVAISPELYGIDSSTKKVRIYKDDMLYFIVKLEDMRVTRIEYWMVEKSFLNVAY